MESPAQLICNPVSGLISFYLTRDEKELSDTAGADRVE